MSEPERDLTELEIAMLSYLWREIDRVYWNHYQEEFDDVYGLSDDKDEIFLDKNIIWTNFLYDFDYEGGKLPDANLIINDKKFWWYKYFGRSMTTDKEERLDEVWFNAALAQIRSCESDK